jgi:hypothetical protein
MQADLLPSEEPESLDLARGRMAESDKKRRTALTCGENYFLIRIY